jgi:hypothetical protein
MGRGNVQANYHGVVGACLILTQYIHVQKVPLKRGWTRQALKTCSLVRFSSALRRSRRSDVTAGPHQWRLLQCHRPTSKSFRYSDSRLKKESHDEKLRPKKKTRRIHCWQLLHFPSPTCLMELTAWHGSTVSWP